jgi:hypothetical protein
MFGVEDVEAQTANAEPVPAAQLRCIDPRVGDGDAAEPLRRPSHRIEDRPIVVAMRIALDNHGAREAERVERREIVLEWRIGRRIAPASE